MFFFFKQKTAYEMRISDWSSDVCSSDLMRRVTQLNLETPLLIAQHLLPAMKAAGFGRIVNISSRAALGKELRSAYAATKAGLIGLTRTWALELARHGITRSEEHTSELQSLMRISYAVFCLKKKKST